MDIKSIASTRFNPLGQKYSKVTNPFERNNFKGRTFIGKALPFSDVFQSIQPAGTKQNKLKLAAASVLGAVSSFNTRISEPINKFANNIKETFMRGVDSLKTTKNALGEKGKTIKNRIAKVFESNKTQNKTDLDMKVLSAKQINNKASVEDLRNAWIAENAKTGEGKAI